MRVYKKITISGNKNKIRKSLVVIFLKERCGQGKGELRSAYTYEVDTLSIGNKVLLKRPARLNKGFDFEVHIEGMNFGERRRSSMPSHRFVINDLRHKKRVSVWKFRKLKTQINKLFKCKSSKRIDMNSPHFNRGVPTEVLLYAIKWLFIEQDVTYWNWSGREMLFNKIKEI